MGKKKAAQKPPPDAAPAPSFLDGWGPALCLAFVFLLYLPTLYFELVLLDDNIFFNERFAYLSDWSNAPKLFRRGSFLTSGNDVFYRPLLVLTVMTDVHLAGRSLPYFHFMNILYHYLCSVLVFALLKKAGLRDRAFLLAGVFAAHPALAQAVGWIPGRTDTVLAAPILASTIFFIDFAQGRSAGFLLAHLACLGAALLIKELAIVVPAICLGYAWLAAPERPSLRRMAAAAAGWCLLLGLWHLARRAALPNLGGYTLPSMFKSLFDNLPALLPYLGKMLLPFGLSPYPILKDMTPAYGIAGAAALGAALLFSPGRDWRAALWGAGWFLVFLLPSFVYPKDAIVPVFFEYRLYLPIVGALLILGQCSPIRDFSLSRPAHRLWGLALVVALGLGAVVNSLRYKDALAHWNRAVEKSPRSAFARKQLATVHFFARRNKEAELQYREALKLNRYEPMVHNNLGVIYMNAGNLDRAAAEYLAELSFNPGSDHAHYNLGLVQFKRGRLDEAAALWRRALEINPDYGEAHVNLAVYEFNRGRYDESRRYLEQAVRQGAAIPPQLAAAIAAGGAKR